MPNTSPKKCPIFSVRQILSIHLPYPKKIYFPPVLSQSVSVNRHLPILDFGKTTGRVFYCSFNPLRTFRTGPNSKNLALTCGFPKRPWVPPSLQIRIVPANRVPTLTCNCLCMYPAQNTLEKITPKKSPLLLIQKSLQNLLPVPIIQPRSSLSREIAP